MTFPEALIVLAKAGFVPVSPFTGVGDFTLQDDSDGRGPYIRTWYSAKTCPVPAHVRQPIRAPHGAEFIAAQAAAAKEVAAAEQERNDMLKAREIVEQATAQVDNVKAAAADAIRLAEGRTAAALSMAQEAIAQRDDALERLAAHEARANPDPD